MNIVFGMLKKSQIRTYYIYLINNKKQTLSNQCEKGKFPYSNFLHWILTFWHTLVCCTYTFCHYLFFSISLFEISLVTLLHSLGDLHCDYDTSSVNYGTPSHLSIGTSSLNTATWTEEAQPSFTDSSISGSLGRASADPGQFLSVAAVIDLFLHKKNHSALGQKI